MCRFLWPVFFICLGYAQVNVDFMSQVSLNNFSIASTQGAGIWGFLDGDLNEYVIMCTNAGTAVFDISNPLSPIEIGMIANANANTDNTVQVYVFDNTPGSFTAFAYVNGGTDGSLQIIDLSNVPASISEVAPNYCPMFPTPLNIGGLSFGIKPTGFTGFVLDSSQASGGIFAMDISNPAGPCDLGSWSTEIVHDLYISSNWIDLSFDGTRLGVAFSGTSFTVVDIDDPSNLATIPGYVAPGLFDDVRSGAVTRDFAYLAVCDIGDEPLGANTQVDIFSISDLTAPSLVDTWVGTSQAIDKHITIVGDFGYLSSTTRGLTVLDLSDPTNVTEHGHYDTFPANDNATLDGAWASYFFNLSGVVALSDRNTGLYILDPNLPDDICRDLDVDNNGFDLTDFGVLLPTWSDPESVLGFVSIVTTCL